MSVEYITGDLFDFTHWNVAVHCVNAQGKMNSGVAKTARDRFPFVYEVYAEAFAKGELTLGTFTVALVPDNRRIVNLVGQDQFGYDGKRYLNYEALYVGLETLRDSLVEAAKEGRQYSVGVPFKMGCDRAGGAFSIVEAMLIHLFAKSDIPLFIVQLPSNTP